MGFWVAMSVISVILVMAWFFHHVENIGSKYSWTTAIGFLAIPAAFWFCCQTLFWIFFAILIFLAGAVGGVILAALLGDGDEDLEAKGFKWGCLVGLVAAIFVLQFKILA